MNSRSHHLTAGLVFLATACTAMPTPRQPQPLVAREPSFAADGMDRSVAPGDDFYLHANGAWQASTPIPADRPWFGVTQQMQDSASEGCVRSSPMQRVSRGARSATSTRASPTRRRWRDAASRRSSSGCTRSRRRRTTTRSRS